MESQTLKHVIKGIIQMLPEHMDAQSVWWMLGINNLTRKHVPVYDHPYRKLIFPNI